MVVLILLSSLWSSSILSIFGYKWYYIDTGGKTFICELSEILI
jgi:hypothetical protein